MRFATLAREDADSSALAHNLQSLLHFDEPAKPLGVLAAAGNDRIFQDTAFFVRKRLDMQVQVVHGVVWRDMETQSVAA